MKWGRKWGNLWGQDLVDPVKIIDYEELPPVAHVSWGEVALGILYHVYVDGKFYDTTSALEMIIQVEDFGRHWVEIFIGGPGSANEDLVAFLTSIPGTRIKLTWTASVAPDISYYNIYQVNGSDVLLGRTKSDEIAFITEVFIDGTYEFRVNPVDLAGNELISSVTETIVLSRYPDAPTEFALGSFNSGTGVASFTFSDSISSGVASYNIYRNDGAGGDIDYNTIIQNVAFGLEAFSTAGWSSGEWDIALRAVNASFEEDNVDIFLSFELGGSPIDILEDRPNIPIAFSIIPSAGGTFLCICTYDAFEEAGEATEINFYTNDGLGGAVNFTSSVATAAIEEHTQGEQLLLEIEATSSGLIDTRTYIFIARAATITGRESENSESATGVADSTVPTDISSLLAAAVNFEDADETPI